MTRLRGRSNTYLCLTTPAVREVKPTGPCPGDQYSTRKCRYLAKYRFKKTDRCAAHTASVLHDLPVGGAV